MSDESATEPVNRQPDPTGVALRLVERRFPHAICAVAAGSFRRGEETPTSDIDLVIIDDSGDAPYRESFVVEWWPVEAFVHTRPSLTRFFQMDAATSTPSLQTMCLDGVVILDRDGLATGIRDEAQRMLDAGRQRLSRDEIDDLRYGVTDTLDDFIGCTVRDEGLFLAAELAQSSVNLLLAANDRWSGHGKWLPRALGRFDQDQRKRLSTALDAYALRADKEPLVAFANEVLAGVGRRLFEGYRRVAPRE
jgi:hypothetical protein